MTPGSEQPRTEEAVGHIATSAHGGRPPDRVVRRSLEEELAAAAIAGCRSAQPGLCSQPLMASVT